MGPLTLVILLCTALPGSPHRDHCADIRIPIVDTMLPNACTTKAQEYIAANTHRFEEGDIRSVGCERRKDI